MTFNVTILGSGTSVGVPIIGREYSPEFLANPKNHRMRSSVYIETDEISKLKGPHGMVHPQLHDGVDGLRRSDALVKGEDRLVDERHQNTVADETGRIVDLDGNLPEALAAFLKLVPSPAEPRKI